MTSNTEEREQRALDNIQKAIDMHEIFERLAIRNHSSFLPHGAVFKVSQDIIEVGDVFAYSLSPLELQNAETKRVASRGGARRLQMSDSGHVRRRARGATEPGALTTTKGYSTTQAISTLKKLLGAQTLRRGDGVLKLPDSRRKERLLAGRTSLATTMVKLEKLGQDYIPRKDTCIRAFVRLLAAQNASP